MYTFYELYWITTNVIVDEVNREIFLIEVTRIEASIVFRFYLSLQVLSYRIEYTYQLINNI